MADASRHSMALVAESTYGTTPATPTLTPIRQTGTTLGLKKTAMQSAELRSDRQITGYRLGTSEVGGDINFELSYGTFDSMLEAATCGTWATGVPIVGTDQLTCGTTRRSFTIERYFTDIATADKPYQRYTGCEFDELDLTISPEKIVMGKFAVVGADLTLDTVAITGASYDPVSTTEVMDSFTGAITEGGSAIAIVTEVSLKLQNGIKARYVVGSKASIEPSIALSHVTGQVTAYFNDSTLLEKFVNETGSALTFTLTGTGGSSYNFNVPNLKYTGGQPDITGPGPITIAMPFQALYDTTTGTNLVIQRTA